MLDINSDGKITYNDLYPEAYDPAKSYVVSLEFNGHEVDFTDADTYYNVSSVNYLAAGACNMSDSGKTLWPLNQIVADTQYYVRDAVIEYVQAQTEPINPAIEGRLQFINDVTGPAITIASPAEQTYLHPEFLTVDFEVSDAPAGVRSVTAKLDETIVSDSQVIDLLTLALGNHTFDVNAVDKAGNSAEAQVTFYVDATPASLITTIQRLYREGKIHDIGKVKKPVVFTKLMNTAKNVQIAVLKGQNAKAKAILKSFINYVRSQSGVTIDTDAANLLMQDAQWIIDHMR